MNPTATILAALGYPITSLFEMLRPTFRRLLPLEDQFYTAQDLHDSSEQKRLKSESVRVDAMNALLHNPLLSLTPQERKAVHIIQGRYDASSRPYDFKGTTINAAHWIPWANRIDKKIEAW